MAKSPNRLSASEAVLRMAQKRLKARDLVEACLDRIEAREGQVHAWEALDPEGARKRADVLDKRSRPVGPAARHSARGEGHHRHQDDAHDLRLADLSRPRRRQGRRLRDPAGEGRRHRAGQVGDHRVRRRPCRQDAQSAQPAPYAGRLLVGLGGGRRRLHGAGGLRHPDRGLGDPARRLQRRRGLQGQLRLGRHDRHQALCADASTRWASSPARPTIWR